MKLKYVMLCLLAVGIIAFADNYWQYSIFSGPSGSSGVLQPTIPTIVPGFVIVNSILNSTTNVTHVNIFSTSNHTALSVIDTSDLLEYGGAILVQASTTGVHSKIIGTPFSPTSSTVNPPSAFFAEAYRGNSTGYLAKIFGSPDTTGFSAHIVGYQYSITDLHSTAFSAEMDGLNNVGLRIFGNGQNKTAADLQGAVILRDNAGTGNAFACFDSEGKLFRSNVPCPRAQ